MCCRKDTIEMILKETRFENVGWIHVHLLDTVMEYEENLTSYPAVRVLGRVYLHYLKSIYKYLTFPFRRCDEMRFKLL